MVAHNAQLPYAFILIIGLSVFPVVSESQAIKSFRDCLMCPEMIDIPKGSFLMGSDYGRSEEKPVHKVSIKKKLLLVSTRSHGDSILFLLTAQVIPKKSAAKCTICQVSI